MLDGRINWIGEDVVAEWWKGQVKHSNLYSIVIYTVNPTIYLLFYAYFILYIALPRNMIFKDQLMLANALLLKL